MSVLSQAQTEPLNALIDGACGVMTLDSTRQGIESLESELMKYEQVEIPVIHRYAGGMYSREITIPANTILTGRIYKEDHFDVMVSGDITVSGDAGRKRMEGFHIFEGVRGKKRAGYAHADTRWITFCASPEMPDDDYLDFHTVMSFSELDLDDVVKDRNDFLAAISELGFSESLVREQSENTDDQEYPVHIQRSDIQGVGLFAVDAILAGRNIMPARIGNTRTIAGRYTNHSVSPNAIMKAVGTGIMLISKTAISAQDEITVDYRGITNLGECRDLAE